MRAIRHALFVLLPLTLVAVAPAHSAPPKKKAAAAKTAKPPKAKPEKAEPAAEAPVAEPATEAAPAENAPEETPAAEVPPKKERFPGPPLPDVDTKIYNLEACLRIADQISPEIMINRMKVVESEAQMAQAKAAAFLPEFTGKLLVGPAPGQTLKNVVDFNALADPPKGADYGNCDLTLDGIRDPNCPQVKVENPAPLQKLGPFIRFEFQFAQPIYTWGKLDAAQSLARSGIRNSQLELTEKRSEIRKRIRELYWGYEAANDAIDLVDDVEKQLADNRDSTKEKIDNGDDDVTLPDLYRMEIFLGQLRMSLEKIYADRDLARTTLAIMLGLDPEDEFKLAEEDIEQVRIDLDPVTFYEDSASVNHFNAKRVGVGIDARRAQLDTLSSWRKPDVFIGGQGFAAWAPRREVKSLFGGDYFHSVGGGIVLGLNFDFNGWMQSAKRDEVLAQYEQARIAQEAAVMGLRIQARKAYYEMVRAQNTVKALTDASSSSRKWFRSTSLNFSVGVETTDNLLMSYQKYLETRGAYLQALFENNKAWAELVQASGLEDLE